MLDAKHFTIIAGADVVAAIRARRASVVPGLLGPTLTSQQQLEARLGYRGAEICEGLLGWIVRYDSSLQEHELLASLASLAEAEAWAIKWQAEDREHRYAWKRKEATQ